MKIKDKLWIFSLFTTGILLMFVTIPSKINAQESSDSVKDVDGNVYKSVKIGTQIWMSENLKTTRYNDSSGIQLVRGDSAWTNRKIAGYCWYNNDEATNKNVYGALYNWFAVNTGKLCPAGWHVPAKDEWMALLAYVNDNGGKLKEAGVTQWYNRSEGATNSSGFTALLGGFRSRKGLFLSIRQAGFWWSATECLECDTFPGWNFDDAMDLSLGRKSSGYSIQHDNKLYGYSIRCLKDN